MNQGAIRKLKQGMQLKHRTSGQANKGQIIDRINQPRGSANFNRLGSFNGQCGRVTKTLNDGRFYVRGDSLSGGKISVLFDKI